MIYKNIKELPSPIKALPVKAQQLFLNANNNSLKRVDGATAHKAAWNVVKDKFEKVNGQWIGKGMGFQLYTFTLKNKGNVFINKADDGEFYLEAMLSDTMVDKDGNKFTEETLKDYADQINTHGVAGFITHRDWKQFCINNSHLQEGEFVAKARKDRKGILKTVKAIYEKGKLWIKALIDKRYVKRVEQFNKVSIEALVPERFQNGKVYGGGYVLGFALDNKPINPRADAQMIKG